MPRSAALHAPLRHACHALGMHTFATATTALAFVQPHRIERLLVGQATRDGAGVKLTRLLTQALQRRRRLQPTLTPFQKATRPLICAAASLGSG
jgi:hypothetical protein